MDEPVRNREEDLRGLASLGDPVRRSLYRFVVDRGVPVGRDEAAAAVGLGRSLAAYHLDKLVGEGLLQVSYERLGGRRGPGAGRPAKLYQRAARQFELSLPARDYALAARIFARAVEDDRCGGAREVALEAGHEVGREWAAEVVWGEADTPGEAPPADGLVGALAATLVAHGYEPIEVAPGVIRLRNCPFERLAEDHRDLVCHMNLAIFGGLASELGGDRLCPVLDPRAGECCVVLQVSAARQPAPPRQD